LLVDPVSDDPLDHPRWRPLNGNGPPRQWLWVVEGLTAKGVATIELPQLTENLETIKNHVANHLVGRVATMRSHIAAGRTAEAAQDWQTLIDDTVANPDDELRGPTWWALQALLPDAERQAAGLAAAPRP
jgi:hypothetical protein